MEINESKLGWYSSWMKLDQSRDTRRQQLAKYKEPLVNKEADGPHLLRFGHLLEYEICAVLCDLGDAENTLVVGGHPQALTVAELLSSQIFRTITPNLLLECELQNRNLLSALLLLEAHGVRAIETPHLETLERNLSQRFRDLKINGNAVSTFDKFRKAQSSAFLYAAIEFLQRFNNTEHRAITALRRVVRVASFALNVAAPALVSILVLSSPMQ